MAWHLAAGGCGAVLVAGVEVHRVPKSLRLAASQASERTSAALPATARGRKPVAAASRKETAATAAAVQVAETTRSKPGLAPCSRLPECMGRMNERHDTHCAHRYQRRAPEKGVLYKVLQEHLGAFVTAANEAGDGIPAFVHKELKGYLSCGVLAHGFARFKCAECPFERWVPVR